MTDTKQIKDKAIPAMHRKTAAGLIAYCEAQLGKPYWYGTFGQVSTKSLYEYNKGRFPSMYKAKDFLEQLGVKVHDCVGLIKGYMWSKDANDEHPAYATNGFKDLSADMLLRHCTKKGTISSIPDVAGVLVFMKGHVGVYIGGGFVIEARGHAYGVVKTELKKRRWTHWAFLNEIYYEDID